MLVYGFDIETTGFSPFEDELISVQYSREDADTIELYPRWEYDSERALLVDFLEDWARIYPKKRIGMEDPALFVGFNTLSFDVPFLFAKYLQDVDICDELGWSVQRCWEELYRNPVYLDLYYFLGADFVGFEVLRDELVGTQADHEGGEVADYYEAGEFEKIRTYVRDELTAMEAMYDALRDTAFFDEVMALRRRIGLKRELL